MLLFRFLPVSFLTALIVLFSSILGFAEAPEIGNHGLPDFLNNEDTPNIKTHFQQLDNQVSVSISIPAVEYSSDTENTSFRIPGAGIIGKTGFPDLPAISKWIRVSDNGKLHLDYELESQTVSFDSYPQMYSDDSEVNTGGFDELLDYKNDLFPGQPITMSQPMLMRGVRLVLVTIFPLQWDRLNNRFNQITNIEFEITSTLEDGVNEVLVKPEHPSYGFDRMLDGLIVNPPHRDDPESSYPLGGYLIVANENTPDATHEFIDWKLKVGHTVELLSINGAEISHDELRESVREVYQDFQFEYLVIMGSDDSADDPLDIPFENDFYDVYYAQMDDDDILPDVAVGSFNCLDEESFTCAIRRAISYQSTPFIDNTEWFTRAGIGVGECSVPDDLSPSYTGKWINEVLSRSNFDDIWTSFYADNGVDDPSRMIENLYNENANFIIVRAHMFGLEVNNIEPGPVFPFQFLVSSGTISGRDNGAFNWIFRMGTPDEMRGPSAGFGHFSSPRTNCANALVGGLIQSLFFLDINTYGWARNYAVANLRRVMVEDGENLMPYYYSHWRYYGDPGQWCWRGVPLVMNIVHPEAIDLNSTDLTVSVLDLDNQPVPNALVCLNYSDDLQLTSRSNSEGVVHFTWDLGLFEEIEAEFLNLTVTGTDLYPYLGEIEIEDTQIPVAISSFIYSDFPMGNRDGIPDSGERGLLYVDIANITNEIGPNMERIWLSTESPYVNIPEFIHHVDSLEAGETITLFPPFPITISNSCPDQTQISIRVNIELEGEESVITGGFALNVTSTILSISNLENFALNPGEISELDIELSNSGIRPSPVSYTRLESTSPFIQIISGGKTYPVIEVDDASIQEGEPFRFNVLENVIPSSRAEFRLLVNSENGSDTLNFEGTISEAELTDPLGPDEYGYIALDNQDNDFEWAEAPEFEWIEINPNLEEFDFEGDPVDLVIGGEMDISVIIDMPFEFIFYGEEFNQITVCSNGWVAVGNQEELVNQQNWMLPGLNGAFGMLAVFWDRLHFEGVNNGLFTFFDEESGRFIIEWNAEVEDIEGGATANIFEVILYDPEEYETPTGDSQVLYQYSEVNNNQDDWEANSFASVGISSPTNLDGLTYSYWREYPPSCPPLDAGLAVLWTPILRPEPILLTGQITRAADSLGVANAQIETSSGFQTFTDQNGNYTFSGIDTGEFDLTVTADNYVNLTIEDLLLEEGNNLIQDGEMLHPWLTDNAPDTLTYFFGILGMDDLITLNAEGEGVSEYNFALLLPDTLEEGAFFLEGENLSGQLESGQSREIEFRLDFDFDLVQTNTYYLSLVIEDNSPLEFTYITLEVEIDLASVPSVGFIPSDFNFHSPYPNPFNNLTNLQFDLPVNSEVMISVFDLSGRSVQILHNRIYSAGFHNLAFNASDFSTGIYLVRLKAGNFSSTKRLLLIK